MTENSTTYRMLLAYADRRETCLQDHDEAMSCLDLEENLVWGMTVFRTMNELEASLQARGGGRPNGMTIEKLADIDACYRHWLTTSEFFLERSKAFINRGYEVKEFEMFSANVEEARVLVGNNELEAGFPSMDTLKKHVRPENPDPSRYVA